MERLEASRLRSILEVAPDAMFAVAADQRICAVNDGLSALFGHAPDGLLGQPLQTLIPKPLRHLDPAVIPRDGDRPSVADQEGRHRDGTLFPIEVCLRRLDLDADGPVILVSVRDVTVRESLRARHQGARHLDQVGQLASGISHDFNNLLTVILCNCSMLGEAVADAEHQGLVGDIQTAATHAVALSRQIVLQSRVPRGRAEVLDLMAMLRRLKPMLERLLGLDIELSISSGGDPGVVRAVPAHVEQFLVHLVLNARDALPKGGQVTIRVEASPPDVELIGPHTRIQIRDDGVGMSENVATQAFVPFFSTKSDGRGTGLGLPMVAELVQASGGSIRLHSTPGKGTRCEIDLPRADALPPVADDRSATAGPRRPGTEVVVLVVPSDALRHTLRRLLAEHGLVVLEAADTAQGVARVRALEASPRLFIIDQDLADAPSSTRSAGSESERTRRVREGFPGAAVLLLTGHNDLDAPPDPEACRIAKPFDADELLLTVDRVLDASTR